MNFPEIQSREDLAVELVVTVINKAQEKLGIRQNLFQLAQSRNAATANMYINLYCLKPPLAITSEKLIKYAIEKIWKLTNTFAYYMRYLEGTTDECSQYYYYEVIFSQPTVTYPIPQVTASVFFRVEDRHIDPVDYKPVPSMIFRVEGHHTDHDVRYVKLIADWILEVLMCKMKFFRRIEKIKIF